MNDRYTFIDLFAGAGGLSEGFISNGYTPIVHVEMNKYAAETLKTRSVYHYLKKNNMLNYYNEYLEDKLSKEELYKLVPEDIVDCVINKEITNKTIDSIFFKIDNIIEKKKIDIVDLIIGGPPCQAYSLLGRAVDENNMEDDPRNYLYKQYVKFLKKYNPKMFVFENVPGILTANKGKTYKNIMAYLRRVGYEIQYKILDAADFGVLQHRRRVILIGWKKEYNLEYPDFKTRKIEAKVKDILLDLSPLKRGQEKNEYVTPINEYLKWSKIRNDYDILTQHISRKNNDNDVQIYKCVIKTWNDYHVRMKYTDLPQELRTHKNQKCFLDRYKVLAADLECSHTMLAHIAKDGHHFIHPDIKQCRSISVREAARIQSFPDNYFFEGPRTAMFTQIGNAVPPLMSKCIAEEIKKLIEGVEQNEYK